MSNGTVSTASPGGTPDTPAQHPSETGGFSDRFVIPVWQSQPELARRARLVTGFGFLGFLFGMIYAGFYLLIGHRWGAGIIVVCSFIFLAAPFIMRSLGALRFAGNLLSATMAAGFTALCCVEGGMEGHAIAWLVSVPLCALLMVGKRAARVWVAICLMMAGGIISVGLLGHKLPMTYDPQWHTPITAAGYLGLISFMFILGMIFELGRERAFDQLQEANQRLEVSNGKLTHLNREKNEFLGIAAHDLKNPLSTIVGYADLLARQPDPAPRLAGQISSSATRMQTLIKNLLDANAIEEGRFTSNIERCDLAELVHESVEHNQMSATRKEITVHVEAPTGLFALADRNAAVQILDNLVSNALKYSAPRTAIRVRAESCGGWARVTVKDQGPGLSAEDQKKLFQKFTRLTARPTGGESSNGLGLSIVKRLAEAMNGSVGCESVLGQGATFYVRLPSAPDSTPSAAQAQSFS